MFPANGVGSIDARQNPFLQNHGGKRLVEGTTLSLETNSWIRLTKFFAFDFAPRFQVAFENLENPQAKVFVENFYGKFLFKNVELEVGRDNILWGQSDESTLYFGEGG